MGMITRISAPPRAVAAAAFVLSACVLAGCASSPVAVPLSVSSPSAQSEVTVPSAVPAKPSPTPTAVALKTQVTFTGDDGNGDTISGSMAFGTAKVAADSTLPQSTYESCDHGLDPERGEDVPMTLTVRDTSPMSESIELDFANSYVGLIINGECIPIMDGDPVYSLRLGPGQSSTAQVWGTYAGGPLTLTPDHPLLTPAELGQQVLLMMVLVEDNEETLKISGYRAPCDQAMPYAIFPAGVPSCSSV